MTASFVVTVSAGAIATLGCRKQPLEVPDSDDGDEGGERISVHRAEHDGACYRDVSVRCPKGVSCNPPAPLQVDCPPDLRDAMADPPAVARRPPGKEDWLRVTPRLWLANRDEGWCSYQPEYFCAPPTNADANTKTKTKDKRRPQPEPIADCTPVPPSVQVRCNFGTDAGEKRFEEFVYVDGLGSCRKVPATRCEGAPSKSCTVPEGEVVPCPERR